MANEQPPVHWDVERLVRHWNQPEVSTQLPSGRWVPARFHGFDSLASRLQLAWDVFKGRADAVYWPEL